MVKAVDSSVPSSSNVVLFTSPRLSIDAEDISAAQVPSQKHITLEPCKGKYLNVRIVDVPPRISTTFANRNLIQYNPDAKPGHQYRHTGVIKPRFLHQRFFELLSSYNKQLLKFVDTIHVPYCKGTTLRCEICGKIKDIQKMGLRYFGSDRARSQHMVCLAKELGWLLTEFTLIARELEDFPFMTSHCIYEFIPSKNIYWKLNPEAWEASIKGLLEIGDILVHAKFLEVWKVWEPVVTAHLTFTCPHLKETEELVELWFREERRKDQKKVMENLMKGEYDNLFAYVLQDDFAKSRRQVRFQLDS